MTGLGFTDVGFPPPDIRLPVPQKNKPVSMVDYFKELFRDSDQKKRLL